MGGVPVLLAKDGEEVQPIVRKVASRARFKAPLRIASNGEDHSGVRRCSEPDARTCITRITRPVTPGGFVTVTDKHRKNCFGLVERSDE